MTKIAPKTSSETTEAVANPTVATLLHLPVGGGGIDGDLELIVNGFFASSSSSRSRDGPLQPT
jgi:hypothetical protein